MSTNILTQAQVKFWYYRAAKILEDGELSDLDINWNIIRQLSNEAFLAGAKWNMKQTSELSPHIAKFIEMMILLGVLDRD